MRKCIYAHMTIKEFLVLPSPVSVPFRGSAFLHFGLIHLNRPWRPRFRLLSGKCISAQDGAMDVITVFEDRFRPLSGKCISALEVSDLWTNSRRFPSPFGEVHFCTLCWWRSAVSSSRRFRPLSGKCISALAITKITDQMVWFVSVPLRGSAFLHKFINARISLAGRAFPSPYGVVHFCTLYK